MAEDLKINLECECCGGTLLKINEGQFECDHCGYTKYIETSTSSEIIGILNHANALRNKGEFDDAGDLFKEVIRKDPNNPEGYWGVFLSDYGIMHVEDPATRKWMPTCNRASGVSVFDDNNYKKSIELSSDLQKTDFASKAENLETIRKKIIDLSKNETPYDVFICYKRTQGIVDGKESYTEDAINARDIYDILTSKGYKVFFAEKTLQHLAGAEYEPLIYNALNTSKVMLVVCSDPELIKAPWVKNEWRRFIKQMEFDQSKKLMPIMCGGMKAGRLPDLLKKYQGLEINANFQNNLLLSINKIVDLSRNNSVNRINIDAKRDVKKSNIVKENIQVRTIGNGQTIKLVVSDEQMLKVAFSCVNREMYKDAIKQFNSLSHNPELKLITDLGLEYIDFKSKHQNKDIIEKINNCISSIDSNVAEIIFDCLEEDFKKAIENKQDKLASILYCAIMTWQRNSNKEIFKIANTYIIQNPNQKSINMLEAIARCYDNTDVDGYIDLLQKYSRLYLDNSSMDPANLALKKIIDVDEGNIVARWNQFLASFSAKDLDYVKFTSQYIGHEQISAFKDFLGYVKEEERVNYIYDLCIAIVESIKYYKSSEKLNNINYLIYFVNLFVPDDKLRETIKTRLKRARPHNINSNLYLNKITNNDNITQDVSRYKQLKAQIVALQKSSIYVQPFIKKDNKLFGDIKCTTYTNIFDEIIKFFSADDKEDLIIVLYAMADELKRLKLFDVASKYYSLIVNEKNTEHKAYWGLLQCKLKCTTNEELVQTHHKLANYNEFNMAIQTAGAVDATEIDNYLAVKQQQDEVRHKNLRKVLTKRISTIFVIALVIAMFGIGIGWYNWYTKPIVTFYNWDGEFIATAAADKKGGSVEAPDMSGFTRPDDYYAKDYKFVGWSASIDEVTKRKEVTAIFEGTPILYDLTVTSPYHGGFIIKIYNQDGTQEPDTVMPSSGIEVVGVKFGSRVVIQPMPNSDDYIANIYKDSTNIGLIEDVYEFTMDHEAVLIELIFQLDGYTPIRTAEDLQNIENDLSAKYYLYNDIDLEGVNWTPIDNFTGVLDGQGHIISNLTLNDTYFDSNNYIGLFGKATNATFKNIKMSNVSISSYDYLEAVGALVGLLSGSNADINNIEVAGTIDVKNSDYVGGIVGMFDPDASSKIYNNLTSNIDVIGRQYVAGIFGAVYTESENASYILRNCTNNGNIKSVEGIAGGIASCYGKNTEYGNRLTCYELYNTGNVTTDGANAGGIFAVTKRIEIYNCSVSGEIAGGALVGAVVGIAEETKLSNLNNENSKLKATSDIDGVSALGGFVGALNSGSISNCVNKAQIIFNGTGSCVGGIAGLVNCGSETFSNLENYVDINITKQLNNVGAIFGYLEINRYQTVNMSNIKITGNVFAINASNVGGVCGYVYTLAYTDQGLNLNSISLNSTIQGSQYVGGLIGYKSSKYVVLSTSNYELGKNAQVLGDSYVNNNVGKTGN